MNENREMVIISLRGFMNSGKTTVQKYIENKYNFRAFSFANVLKNIVACTFGFDREMLEGDTVDSRTWREQPDNYWSEKLMDTRFLEMIKQDKKLASESSLLITPRLLLQHFADLIKKYLGDNFLCDSMKRMIIDANEKRIIIADMRFKQEHELIVKNLGGIVWGITRKQTDPGSIEGLHRSETDLLDIDIDFSIENNKTIEDLHLFIDRQMEKMSIKPLIKIDSFPLSSTLSIGKLKKIDGNVNKRKMSAPRIGVDIDGVLYYFHLAFKDYMHKMYGKPLQEMSEEPDCWNFFEKWGLNKEEFNHYFREGVIDGEIFRKGEMIKGAASIINKLKNQLGCSIHLISNRNVFDVGHIAMNSTKDWLSDNNLQYDTINFDYDKGKYVEEFSLDYFIEDSELHAEQVLKAGCKKIFLFDQLWNKKEECKEYRRVGNWEEVGVLIFSENVGANEIKKVDL